MNLFSYCTIAPKKLEKPRRKGDRSIILEKKMILSVDSATEPKNIWTSCGMRKYATTHASVIRIENEERMEFIVARSSGFPALLVKTGISIEAETSEATVANSTSGILKAA